ncbi:MAG: hypothetical protein K0A89_10095 [ANME-2 cluster archaeon]|nr:hypothetical protein [ANME-2 cluster archaeon]
MGLDILSIKIRWNNFIIVAGIAIMSLFLVAGIASADPPPSILKINGNEQTSGIGSYCWKVENETYSICGDTIGIITPAEPLFTMSPFTAHLILPLQEPLEELGFSVTRVTDEDELREAVNETRAWRLQGKWGDSNMLPLEREPEINLSLEPGLYVLNIFVEWEEIGDVSYGFLVQVNNPETEVTNNISSGEKTAGFEVFLAIMTLLFAIVIRRNRK